jgi:radical SAM superfamily enzyme YgiQ (UPF0313 family)
MLTKSYSDPFATSQRKLWFPAAMKVAPELGESPSRGTVKKRTTLLINPFYPKEPHASFGKHVLTPTTGLSSIAAATPPDWEVSYWDENLLQGPPPSDPVPEAVGITVHLTFAHRAYELARWYRARGACVVLGGPHMTACRDEAAPHADAVAVGDGVQLWPAILHDIENGTLKPLYHAGFDLHYRTDPAPRRDLLPRRSFLTTTSVIASRGCHNRCGFCYLSTEGLRMPYQTRDPEQVAREIAADDQPYAVFIDNNLGSCPAYLRELCRALRPLNMIWSAAVSLDVSDEPSLVREMALAGCTGVFIGFETLSDRNLADAKKKTPKTEDYGRRVELFHDHGIQVNSSFVVGFDDDHKDVFERTAAWVEEHRIECSTFHILTPYPGTPLFRQLEAEGRLLHKDWRYYDTAHVVFRPRHMTPEELLAGYGWLYRRLFSHASIWRRRPDDIRAIPPYLAMSYLYKRSNRFWHFLIKHRLVHFVWRPLVEFSRLRHLHFRKKLERRVNAEKSTIRAGMVVSAGV